MTVEKDWWVDSMDDHYQLIIFRGWKRFRRVMQMMDLVDDSTRLELTQTNLFSRGSSSTRQTARHGAQRWSGTLRDTGNSTLWVARYWWCRYCTCCLQCRIGVLSLIERQPNCKYSRLCLVGGVVQHNTAWGVFQYSYYRGTLLVRVCRWTDSTWVLMERFEQIIARINCKVDTMSGQQETRNITQ